jgi:hypothetical protein
MNKINMVIKSRRVRWATHVARIEENRNAYEVLAGHSEGKKHVGDTDVHGSDVAN